MAAFASESNLQPDAFSSTNPSGSPFNIPGFFIRFSTKTSADNDSAKSPTSPLDLVLSSFKNPFGFRCQKSSSSSSSHTGSKRMLHCTKVGLGIINSLADETQVFGEVVDAPEMKNILFRPQVEKKKTDSSSNVGGNGGLEDFCSESKAVVMSLPTHVQNSLVTKPSSLPVSTNGTALSAREIELSEDYTCVTCHGPNPKTTHIFGDCILECHTKGENVSIHRGKNPFCSLECGSGEIFAEEETEQSFDSSHEEEEDLFLMAFHAST